VAAGRKKNHHGFKKIPFAAPATVSSNESEAADEKIENWYTTYKARLEPKTRRLMVVTKPTTARHQSQLKIMRKHHWECRTEIEQHLKRHIPTAFSLKIVRSRIDWERVAPYITLMIQAVSARISTIHFRCLIKLHCTANFEQTGPNNSRYFIGRDILGI
jgi:GTPase SAR1 family protein